ncbi:LysR family transcriptional regulator [Rubellimicrobium roseum]|uniref:LysR family transcriptional regulator n=1 Tax=Rubellimicrobium roseum TaxID=687525 RepID=A0A5C4NAP2_9RHOB|nr:LysR family transcriptional regulator [Rubellimicrobium roseum]
MFECAHRLPSMLPDDGGSMRRLDNIDIRLLRVFMALADAGGFAEAQVALNLSQSTLSTH